MSGIGENAIVSAANQNSRQFLSVQIPLTYEHLIWKYFIRRSVGQAAKGRNLRLLELFFFRLEVYFFLSRFLLPMIIYSVNILSVSLSVRLQKAEL